MSSVPSLLLFLCQLFSSSNKSRQSVAAVPGLLGYHHKPLRQGEGECGALLRFSLRPDAAAMAAHYALHGRQAYAAALVLFLAMQALEGREEAVGILHRKPGTVVAHIEGGLLVALVRAHLDL